MFYLVVKAADMALQACSKT